MKSLNKNILIFVIIIITIFLIFFSHLGVLENNSSIRVKNFELISEEKGAYSTNYAYSSNDSILKVNKIGGLEKEARKRVIEEEIINIEGIYSNQFSPYPGELSNEIVCNPKFKPIYQEKEIGNCNYQYYFLYTNERFGLGVCDEQSIMYKYLLGWFSCESNKEVYTINYFAPTEFSFEEMEKIFLELKY